jgi:hypothetical protein
MQAPTVFIGSSHEHLKTAHALKTCLSSFVDATVWDEAAFDLNESIFGGLLHFCRRLIVMILAFSCLMRSTLQ